MKCSIMQPTYLPWIGYFDLIDQADKFVFLDNVQLVRRSWQIRNRIKTSQGELYLSLPVKKTGGRAETILNNACLDMCQDWRRKHLRSIYLSYRKSSFYCEIYSFLETLYLSNIDILSDFTINIIREICRKMGISKEFIKSSEINNLYGTKDVLLASICKNIDCHEYISAKGSSEYIEKFSPGGEFTKNGIKLYYHDYNHPVYAQNYGAFISYMSIIDLLFNCGFEESLGIIRSGRRNLLNYQVIHNNVVNTL